MAGCQLLCGSFGLSRALSGTHMPSWLGSPIPSLPMTYSETNHSENEAFL